MLIQYEFDIDHCIQLGMRQAGGCVKEHGSLKEAKGQSFMIFGFLIGSFSKSHQRSSKILLCNVNVLWVIGRDNFEFLSELM